MCLPGTTIDDLVKDSIVRTELNQADLDTLVARNFIPILQSFWRRPEEYKRTWSFDWDERRKVFDTGYSDRKDAEDKELFHYRLGMTSRLDNAEVDWQEYGGICILGEQIWQIGYQTALAWARLIDAKLGTSFAAQVSSPEAQAKHVVRALNYRGRTKDPLVVAQEHTDLAWGTVTLRDSYTALRVGGKFVAGNYFFAGRKLEQATNGLIKAKLHTVAERRRSLRGDEKPRWSVVFFAHI